MTFTEEQIQQQKDFVKAICFQKEAAYNTFKDNENYYKQIEQKHKKQSDILNMMIANPVSNEEPKETDV
jgi:hypothetical protein